MTKSPIEQAIANLVRTVAKADSDITNHGMVVSPLSIREIATLTGMSVNGILTYAKDHGSYTEWHFLSRSRRGDANVFFRFVMPSNAGGKTDQLMFNVTRRGDSSSVKAQTPIHFRTPAGSSADESSKVIGS